MALPGSPITVRTSSKSTFTWPYSLMISAMPPTAFFSTSLAWAKASSWVMSSPSTSSSFSLSTTISESTLASSSARPASALHAAAAFPVEGLGHHAHGQDAHFLGHAGDHRRRAGAGAAAHAGGDEQHVRAFDGSGCLPRPLRRHRGPCRACCRRPGRCRPAGWCGARCCDQRLGIGVGADELHALHAAAIMCSTALPPPPPTPITLICVPWLNSSASIISMVMLVLLFL
jgi:hypothetical protein